MNKPNLLYLTETKREDEVEPNDLFDHYLDCLVVGWMGIVPPEQRRRWKEETRFHLDRLKEDLERSGMTQRDAAKEAIHQYGNPAEMSQILLASYFRKKEEGKWVKRFGYGNIIAFSTFAALQIVCLAVFQLRVLLPSESALNYAVNPVIFHSVFPDSVPVPEFSVLYSLSLVVALISPLVAGTMIGKKVMTQTAKAIINGLLPCLLYTLVAGLLLLPSREVLLFGLIQVVWWIPSSISVALAVAWATKNAAIRKEAEGIAL
ncbi:MAG: permease prefix domain 1-containing protein [Fimbriimonadaceae bacterium]|jgi:hypothetical protein|nr:permease prefix domain 1-containing protein [Fimbriimonadaceae bacterium]